MLARVPYETAEDRGVFLDLDIPDKNLLKAFVPTEPDPLPDLIAAVDSAITQPVAGPSITELIGKSK